MAAISSDSEGAERENNENEKQNLFEPNSTRANWKRNSVYNQMLKEDYDKLDISAEIDSEQF